MNVVVVEISTANGCNAVNFYWTTENDLLKDLNNEPINK